jgi:hypothetical protein
MKIYNIYRAFKAKKRLYIAQQGLRLRLMFGSSKEQASKKFIGWRIFGV